MDNISGLNNLFATYLESQRTTFKPDSKSDSNIELIKAIKELNKKLDDTINSINRNFKKLSARIKVLEEKVLNVVIEDVTDKTE